jgi:hypothetical protein
MFVADRSWLFSTLLVMEANPSTGLARTGSGAHPAWASLAELGNMYANAEVFSPSSCIADMT